MRVIREGLAVALIGAAFAFLANAVSPNGLKLSRNYFPGDKASTQTNRAVSPSQASGTNGSATNPVAERLVALGLTSVSHDEAVQLYNDPRRSQDLIVFVDARDDTHFAAGHIPGAYQLDHFRAERYLAEVLPRCLAAEKIIVYCNGGDCDLSEHAAVLLRELGVAADKLAVYLGGIHEWEATRQPVELGARNSGNFKENKS